MVVPLAVSLDSEGVVADGEGVSSNIVVNADASYSWSVSGAPAWMKIDGSSGAGSGKIFYSVSKNSSNQDRSAVLLIGDAVFEIKQNHLANLQIPYRDQFRYPAPPPPVWELAQPGAVMKESPTHWVWVKHSGQNPRLQIVAESPSEGKSLLVENLKGDPSPWAMQLFLPRIDAAPGIDYRLTVSIKAESADPISIGIGENEPPYGSCGFARTLQVTNAWTKYDLRFRLNGQRCEGANHRLYIGVGQIRGKVWISDFALTAEQ
jgi:hypothetical protein